MQRLSLIMFICRAALVVFCACLFGLNGCFLFPPITPTNKPDSTNKPQPPTQLLWVKSSRGNIMDVSPVGNIVTIGDYDDLVRNAVGTVIQTFSPEGVLLQTGATSGFAKDVVANRSDVGSYNYITQVFFSRFDNTNSNYTFGSGVSTNPYTKYDTYSSAPEKNPSPYAGYEYVVGPSITKAMPERDYTYRVAVGVNGTYSDTITRTIKVAPVWLVGTFCDKFQYREDKMDFSDPNDVKYVHNHPSPTLGKADCFVLMETVRHQWGGPENDLAYDVASDNIGNATIFLRAGTPFPITSATRTLVNVQTGYNIVRLDTNGLLTETFPVTLPATGEIGNTQIVLGNNGAVYILAEDIQKKQYFLAKVHRSGTIWLRYLPPAVSDREKSVPINRNARMGITVDSKDCAYLTGNFSGRVDFGGVTLTSETTQVFAAKYSPSNACQWAVAMGDGCGVSIKLSPQEDALYVNGWAAGSIMGTYIPSQDMPRQGILRPGAFLVKLKLTK